MCLNVYKLGHIANPVKGRMKNALRGLIHPGSPWKVRQNSPAKNAAIAWHQANAKETMGGWLRRRSF
jgi:hypothetical protein